MISLDKKDGVKETFEKLESKLNNGERFAVFARYIGLFYSPNEKPIYSKNFNEVTVIALPKPDQPILAVDYGVSFKIPIVIPPLKKPSSQSIDWQPENWAFSCDFHGNDLSNAKIRGEDCGGRCASTPGCTHFTWNNYEGGTCWMKQGGATKNDAFKTDNAESVCGLIGNHATSEPIDWQPENWAFSCDFHGNDLSNAKIRGEDCGGRCASTPGCTHFTWTNYEGGTCWMKQGGATKNNAFKTDNAGSVCGWIS
jgi:hypothetical protein